MVGVGTRGHYLLGEVQKVPNTEVRVICDLYEGNIARAKELTKNPNVRIVKDWEKAVADKDVDAVVIATPDFWHAPMTIRAAEAKKDIYVEKGWCRTLDEAKPCARPSRTTSVVMQLGHNYNSLPTFHKARQIFAVRRAGQGAAGAHLYRPHQRATRSGSSTATTTSTRCPRTPAKAAIDWKRFIANAPARPFDAERFFTWRNWWDYGTGIAGDLMAHLWDSVNMVLGMGIPETAVTQGGLYFWKDGRDVPDMWHVLFDYPKKELAVTFACSFHNRHAGEMAQYLGREKTMEVSPAFCRTYIAEWKQEYYDRLGAARRAAVKAGRPPEEAVVEPDYSFKKGDVEVTDHMTEFHRLHAHPRNAALRRGPGLRGGRHHRACRWRLINRSAR